MASLPNAAKVVFEPSDNVELVHCGESFEDVRCPRCNTLLEIEAWQDAMNAAYDDDGGFVDLTYETECCGHVTSLNDLTYSDPMGFARARLEVQDPQAELPERLVAELESLLGCELRTIHAHY